MGGDAPKRSGSDEGQKRQDGLDLTLDRGLNHLARRARGILLLEQATAHLWPLACVLGLGIAFALLDLPALLPGALHFALLILFFCALATAALAAAALPLPARRQALRRVEEDSALPHRPLSSADESLATGGDDPFALALWRAHRQRLAQILPRLRLAPPRALMAHLDPLGLRALVVLLIVLGSVVAGHEAPARLSAALHPGWTGNGPPATLQLWITPPAYSGQPQLTLALPSSISQAQLPPPLKLPAGSHLKALLQGGHGTAIFDLDQTPHAFAPVEQNSQQVEMTLDSGRLLTLRQGRKTLGRWPVVLLQPTPPEIKLLHADVSEQSEIRVELDAADEYGLASWGLIITRPGKSGELPLDLPLSPKGAKQTKQTHWLNLTAHPWAGLPVLIQAVARNVAGLESRGETQPFTLPEREFHNEVAQRIIDLRRVLADQEFTLPSRRAAAEGLFTITNDSSSFGEDTKTYLSLRSALYRLARSREPGEIPGVLDLMWHGAQRIEDGGDGERTQSLMEKMNELQKGLETGDAAFDQALAEAQAALAEAMKDLPPTASSPDGKEEGPVVTEQDLQALLKRIRDLARTGAKDKARQMLSELTEMLHNARRTPMTPEQSKAQHALAADLQALAALTHRQQALNERTRSIDAGSPANALALAQEQDSIRESLAKIAGQLQQDTGEAPNALQKADGQQGKAATALRNDKAPNAPRTTASLGTARAAQDEALRLLQQGQQQAQASAGRALGRLGVKGVPAPSASSPWSRAHDPFGRASGDPFGNVAIPDQGEANKAQSIIDELRRRASEGQRPPQEKDYLQRLLTPY